MKIFDTKDEAEEVAERLQREHLGAEVSDGEISFCGMQDGTMVERKVKTSKSAGRSMTRGRDGWTTRPSSYTSKQGVNPRRIKVSL